MNQTILIKLSLLLPLNYQKGLQAFAKYINSQNYTHALAEMLPNLPSILACKSLFNSGFYDVTDFRQDVCELLGVDGLNDELFDDCWNQMLGTIDEENLSLLKNLASAGHTIILLADTNPIHVEALAARYPNRFVAKSTPPQRYQFDDLPLILSCDGKAVDSYNRPSTIAWYQQILEQQQLTPTDTVLIIGKEESIATGTFASFNNPVQRQSRVMAWAQHVGIECLACQPGRELTLTLQQAMTTQCPTPLSHCLERINALTLSNINS